MSRKTIFRGLMVIAAIAILFFSVLVIHVFMVTKSKNDDPRLRQLARIDFKEQLDSVEQQNLKNKVLSIPGVDAAHYNADDHILVYSYNPEILHSDLVYYQLMEEKKYNAHRFVVATKNSNDTKGCPVIDKSSFSYQFANAIQEIIK